VGVVRVVGRPVVAVLSTGDELTDAGGWADGSPAAAPPTIAPLAPGRVYDANRPLLLASAAAAGAAVVDLGIAPDDARAVEAALDAALASDAHILVTTGGVSMGATDAVKPALAARGTIHFGKCCMKPGKPLTFATLGRPSPRLPLLVFGLPGNPASAAVTFALVVGPAIRALAGWAHARPRRVHVRTEAGIKLDPERPEYHRAVLAWTNAPPSGTPVPASLDGASPTGLPAPGWFTASSTGGQISSRLGSVRGATALLELPARAGVLPAGSVVSALLVGDVGGMPVMEVVAGTPGL
jgi:gephyrin